MSDTSLSHFCAFAKINKEAMEECQRRIDEPWSLPSRPDTPRNSEAAGEPDAKLDDNSGAKTSLSDKDLCAKETAIRSEYADRKFHIYDVKSFFQEFIKAWVGLAPSSEA